MESSKMQYRFVGQDPQGRLLYEPVMQDQVITPAKPMKAAFDTWFVTEEGVISMSLKKLT